MLCCCLGVTSRIGVASARRRRFRFRCVGSETAFRRGAQAVHTTWGEGWRTRTGLSHPSGPPDASLLGLREGTRAPACSLASRSAHDVTDSDSRLDMQYCTSRRGGRLGCEREMMGWFGSAGFKFDEGIWEVGTQLRRAWIGGFDSICAKSVVADARLEGWTRWRGMR